jgi:FAD:protein FMN transferase
LNFRLYKGKNAPVFRAKSDNSIFEGKMRYTLLLFLITVVACQSPSGRYTKLVGFTQGTTYNIIYDDTINLRFEIETILAEFDSSLSVYNDQSVISAINRNEQVSPDSFFTAVFDASRHVSSLSEGAFDITVGPLVRAYGFGSGGQQRITDALIDSLLQFVGYQKVWMENGEVKKSDPGIQLDVNAIAQGYAVDVICEYFQSRGIRNYLVEIGGEVRAVGLNPSGENWRVGIDKPIDDTAFAADRKLKAIVNISGRSLATSGNYRKFRIDEGMRYSHTIDPRTGRMVGHTLLSVTVLADQCMMADAWATAFMVLGPDKAFDIAAKENLEIYLILAGSDNRYEIRKTAGFDPLIGEEFD